MNVLVTGAAGFIGSHLVRALSNAGHRVRAVDNLSGGKLERLDDVFPQIEWREADVCDAAAMAEAVRDVECVLHQAAIPSVVRSVQDPVENDRANVLGTVTLLQAARDAGVRRFVYASSSSVYGDSPELPKRESMREEPASPYAAGKLACELYARVFARLGLLETVGLRYFNVYGPHQDPKSDYAAVIPRFCEAIIQDRALTLFGDGEQSRDFVYVEDVVRANLRALEAEGVSGAAFNVGGGAAVTLNELVRLLGSLLGVEPKVSHAAPRPGDVRHSLAAIDRARAELGFEPTVSLEEGLRRTLDFFREPR